MEEFVNAKFVYNGINIAYANVPKNYLVSGQIVNQWQHDLVPFGTFLKASSPDNKVILSSFGRQIYEDYLNPLQKSLILKIVFT